MPAHRGRLLEKSEGLELRGLVIYAMDTKVPGEACRHIRLIPTTKEVASQIAWLALKVECS